MQHLKQGRKFGRIKNQRRALILGLARNLIRKERIRTTEAKAKELKICIEKMISRAKNDNLASRRFLLEQLGTKEVNKLFSFLAPRYKDWPGGYLRILKLGARKNDGAKISLIEFVKPAE